MKSENGVRTVPQSPIVSAQQTRENSDSASCCDQSQVVAIKTEIVAEEQKTGNTEEVGDNDIFWENRFILEAVCVLE